ncbi:MAG: histidine phosphotransferase family protein [Shimia sp.]
MPDDLAPSAALAQPDLIALLGSRICHDLVNPLGAISNGVELVQMDPGMKTPEMALIADSVANAAARVNFFRVAFGAAAPGHTIAAREVAGLLAALEPGARIRYRWTAQGAHPRDAVRLVFLLVQCVESAMPLGGTVAVFDAPDGSWRIEGDGDRIMADPGLWDHATRGLPVTELAARDVHFALARNAALDLGRPVTYDAQLSRLSVRVG